MKRPQAFNNMYIFSTTRLFFPPFFPNILCSFSITCLFFNHMSIFPSHVCSFSINNVWFLNTYLFYPLHYITIFPSYVHFQSQLFFSSACLFYPLYVYFSISSSFIFNLMSVFNKISILSTP
jgi:hypothetical protein